MSRTLFEPGELVRSSQCWRPSPPIRPDGASMVLATFAETKVARGSGTKPRHKLNPQILALPST